MERDDRRTDERRRDERGRDERTGRAAAAERIRNQSQWVDLQVQEAMRRGDFDDLPGAGKPIRGLGGAHDPDWWVKGLVEREQLHLAPPAIALRTEDAELDDQLDRLGGEQEVRRRVEDFNERIRHAIYTNLGGPPVITPRRDVETEVARWRERREARRATVREAARMAAQERATQRRTRRWWRRR